MAYIKKENKAPSMKDYVIYAILSPFTEKKVHIGITLQNRLYKRYSEHFNLRISKTNKLFEDARKQKVLPPMFELERGQMTKEKAFSINVAWMKYFLDHGYEQVTKDVLIDYANDLTKETKAHYILIKDELIEDLLQPEGGLFPNYRMREKESTVNPEHIQVWFKLTPEEHKKLKNNAESQGTSLAAYCKQMSLNGQIVQFDASPITEFLDQYRESKTLLRKILVAIHRTKKYYQADLKNIQGCIDQLSKLQKEAITEMTKMVDRIRN